MLTFNLDLHFIYCVARHQLISYLYLWNHCLPSQWRRWAFVCNQWVCTCDLWGSGLRSIYPIWTSLSFFSVCGWCGSCFVYYIENNVRGVSACKTKLSKVVQLQVGSHQLRVNWCQSGTSNLFLPAIRSHQDPVFLHPSLPLFDCTLYHFLISWGQSLLELVTP